MAIANQVGRERSLSYETCLERTVQIRNGANLLANVGARQFLLVTAEH